MAGNNVRGSPSNYMHDRLLQVTNMRIGFRKVICHTGQNRHLTCNMHITTKAIIRFEIDRLLIVVRLIQSPFVKKRNFALLFFDSFFLKCGCVNELNQGISFFVCF